jgi:hypothetical protein
MTKTIVDELPSFYKDILQNKKHESPTSIYYGELQRNEEMRKRVRETSRLYPMFKEDIMSFVTAKGDLNLPIQLEIFDDFVKDIYREIELSDFIIALYRKLDETPSIPVVLDTKNDKDIWLSPKYKDEIKKIDEDIKDMRDALTDIMNSNATTLSHPGFRHQVYLNRGDRELVKAIHFLMSKIARRKLEIHNQQFIALSVKPKELDQFVKSINWRAVFVKK